MSDLFGNHEDRFSQNKAHLIWLNLTSYILRVIRDRKIITCRGLKKHIQNDKQCIHTVSTVGIVNTTFDKNFCEYIVHVIVFLFQIR